MPTPTDKFRFGIQRFSWAACCMAVLVLGCSNNDSSPSGKISGSSKSTPAGADSAKKIDSSKSETASKTGSLGSKKIAKPDVPKKPKVSTEPDLNEPEFHDALLAATEEYLQYGMVNSIVLPAPEACAPAADAPKPLMSESDHESSHGKKLYFLFAKEIGHYVSPGGKPAPVGQVIVKESWTASPSHPGARNLVNHASGNRVDPRTKVGSQMLEIGQRKSFFVMTKLAVNTPKTDNGWVYGVVDADTRKVVASGKVASCMSCHVEADNDRLFGSKQFSYEETVVSEVEVEESPKANESSKTSKPKAEDVKKGSTTKAPPEPTKKSGSDSKPKSGK